MKNIFYETFVNVLPQDANCVIKNVIREGYGEFLKEGLAEDQLKQRLDVSLDRWLHHPLMAQGLTYHFGVVKTWENQHTITVYGKRKISSDLILNRAWVVGFEAKVVLLDSLEQLAGLAVAKSLGVRGEEGLEKLDCAGKLKEVVRLLMDKNL